MKFFKYYCKLIGPLLFSECWEFGKNVKSMNVRVAVKEFEISRGDKKIRNIKSYEKCTYDNNLMTIGKNELNLYTSKPLTKG